MKQILFIVMLIAGISLKGWAQTAEDSVKTVINNMFTAMKTIDRELLRSCFTDSAILQTIGRSKEGKLVVQNEPLEEFLEFIIKEKKGSLDERITFDVVKTDGPLAIAWTPYSFYYQEKFSHCGVNSFQLVRTDAG